MNATLGNSSCDLVRAINYPEVQIIKRYILIYIKLLTKNKSTIFRFGDNCVLLLQANLIIDKQNEKVIMH